MKGLIARREHFLSNEKPIKSVCIPTNYFPLTHKSSTGTVLIKHLRFDILEYNFIYTLSK
ncbi:hypothetical protein GCM10027347_36820 [Larkinella harenae]